MITRTYSELVKLKTFEERFEYLKLNGDVGSVTFGFDRYLNQIFYRSPEWASVRMKVILRDNGFDLGIQGYEIRGRVYIHHMNPIEEEDLLKHSLTILDPEYLICVSHNTHNAIHYGDKNSLESREFVERHENDTCPWR